MKNRILILLLAAAIILSILASCTTKGEGGNGTTQIPTTESSEPGTDPSVVANDTDDLPEKMDFNNREINILYRVEGKSMEEIDADKESSSVVDQALFSRNEMIQERLNCYINPIYVVGTMENIDEVSQRVYDSEFAGTKLYDLAAAMSLSMTTLQYQGCLTNLNSLQYFKADKDYYSQGFREALSVDDCLYAVTGPMSLSYYRYAYATLFNQDLFRDMGTPFLYETVDAGDWTIEKMEEIAKVFYFDYNGDGIYDKNDTYGYYTHTGDQSSMMDGFWECFQLQILGKGEVEGLGSNYYTYSLEAESFTKAIDNVINLLKSEGTFASAQITDNDVYKAFAGAQAAMVTVRLNTLQTSIIREMRDTYGIVPLPKCDSLQEDYASSIQAEVLLYCIPRHVDEVEQIGAFLEAFASTGYKEVRPVYYDTVLRGRYANDPESVAMLDLIAKSVFIDPINFYRGFGFNRESLRSMWGDQQNSFSSTIGRHRTTIKENLDTINQSFYDVYRDQSAS